MVNAVPLPSSTERLVRIEENRGNVKDGIVAIMTFLNGQKVFFEEKSYKPAKNICGELEMASKISFRIKEGEIWNILMVKNMIPDLKERLGVQINVSEDQLITVAGSVSGVEMCKCIQVIVFITTSSIII